MATEPGCPEPVLNNRICHNSERPGYRKKKKKLGNEGDKKDKVESCSSKEAEGRISGARLSRLVNLVLSLSSYHLLDKLLAISIPVSPFIK